MDSMFTCEQRPSRRERRDAERMDSLHRIMTGQASNRRELNVAGFFIAGWFVMDLVQWVDWLVSKFH